MVTAGLALLLGAFTSQAQSGPTAVSTNASGGLTTVTFFASAENYLTTFNPDYTWTNVTLEAATGYKQVTGTGAASVLDVQYDLGRWNLGTACQFSGVGSPVNAMQAQGGYALIRHLDAKVDFDLRAGYDWTAHTGVIEPAVFLGKKLTANTYLKTGISLPVYFRGSLNRNPSFFLETGFTY